MRNTFSGSSCFVQPCRSMIALPELPSQLVVHILKLLPPIAQAYSGKLVNKAAYKALKASRLIAASTDVPVWVLQQYLPEEQTAEAKVQCLAKLLNHRAAAGDLQGVMYLRSQGAQWDHLTTAAAAGAGQLGVLLYLRAQHPPCDWDVSTCNAAAASGHLEVLQWCRSQHPPAPWADSTASAAATAGHLATLQWLLKPYPALTDVTNINPGCQPSHSKSPLTDSVSKVLGISRPNPMRPEPCPWSPWYRCAIAAKAGQLHVLKWLRANGATWNAGVCAAAAAGGHVHILEWLLSQSPPCPIDNDSLFEAASEGHLHVLKYLQSHVPDIIADEYTSLAAAIGGHFEVLTWLRQQVPPCPWVAGTTAAAAASGNKELVLWLKAQGAP